MDENVALLDQVLTTPRLTYSPLIFLLQFYYHSSESLFGAYSIWLNCLHFQAKKWNMDIFPVEIALSFFPATSNYFILIASLLTLGFPSGSAGKKSACNVGDLGSIPGLGRSLGERKGYPLQYSGLENSTDCIVHGVAKSRTRLSNFHFHFSLTLITIHLSLFLSRVITKSCKTLFNIFPTFPSAPCAFPVPLFSLETLPFESLSQLLLELSMPKAQPSPETSHCLHSGKYHQHPQELGLLFPGFHSFLVYSFRVWASCNRALEKHTLLKYIHIWKYTFFFYFATAWLALKQ